MLPCEPNDDHAVMIQRQETALHQGMIWVAITLLTLVMVCLMPRAAEGARHLQRTTLFWTTLVIVFSGAVSVGWTAVLVWRYRLVGANGRWQHLQASVRSLFILAPAVALLILTASLASQALLAPPVAVSHPGTRPPEQHEPLRTGDLAREISKLWHNIDKAKEIEKELEDAERLKVVPVHITSPRSLDPIAKGEGAIFKWVLTEDLQLLALPKSSTDDTIKHSVATKGGPVRAAGEGIILGPNRVEINHHSGHYKPKLTSIVLGWSAFVEAGFSVELTEKSVGADKPK